ncbi:MAG: hypothetical protein AAF721_34775 [Myxococcota bacterium]
MLVVQQIRAVWRADGRGSDQAQRRAGLPDALMLPGVRDPCGYVLHRADAEGPTFALEESPPDCRPVPPRQDDFLRYPAEVIWRGAQAWAPPRRDLPLNLENRRWVRVVFNGRTNDDQHGEFSDWVYQSVVLNVGRFASAPDRDVFVRDGPEHTIDLRRSLW